MKPMVPYRFKRLAETVRTFIGVMIMYRRDLDNNQITPLQFASDLSDFITLGLVDADLIEAKQKQVVSALIEDLKGKYNL